MYWLGMTRFISFEGIVLDRKWFCATQEEGVYSILSPIIIYQPNQDEDVRIRSWIKWSWSCAFLIIDIEIVQGVFK